MTTSKTHRADPALDLVLERVVDVPRERVWAAWTQPEHLKRWWGPRRTTMTHCEIDLRPGGAWRYVLRDDESGRVDAWSGVYKEIAAPERVVYTEGWEALPGHDYVVTATFDEKDGKTTLTSRLHYKSIEDRDGHIQSGMEPGMRETYDRLGDFLTTLASG